ncbi:MAG: response regulator transcription factor [Chlorobiales bacterium]|nr:response regulator transcription factor [Chlorobiales bacterium]
MNKKSIEILIVDDCRPDIVLMREAVAETGQFRVVSELFNGNQAIDYLTKILEEPTKRLPDIVLLDINMPGMNGFETLRAVKANEKLRHIPVVVLTTSNRKEDVMMAYAYGASSYVRKPSSFSELCRAFEQLANYWTGVSVLPRKCK